MNHIVGWCAPSVVFLCAGSAKKGLRSFPGSGSIPMAVSNDHYYGYVNAFLAEYEDTWLECATTSLMWSSILVCDFFNEDKSLVLSQHFKER